MANNFTQFSFKVAMPQEQAEWCVALHQTCIDCFDDAEVLKALQEAPGAPAYMAAIAEMAEDYNYAGTGCDMEADATGLWVHTEESANVEYIADFMGLYLRHFEIRDQAIGFTWANTCSKMMLDSFDGGACVVTHDDAKFLSADSWMANTIKEMTAPQPA